MPYLPVDTAVLVIMGPLIDDTDFKTRETGVAHNAAGMDVALIKASGTGTPTFTALTPTTGSTQDWVHLGDGWYSLEITAAQNDTEGTLVITGFATGVLPWRSVTYDVVPVLVYNSLVLGTDNLQVDAVQHLGTAYATPSVAGVPEVDLTHVAGATTNVSALATNVAAILDDTGTSGVVLPAATIDQIVDEVWDEDATGHQTQGTFGQAIGDPVADTNTIYKAVVTDAAGANVAADIVAVKAETATILADTNELQTDWVNGGRLDLILDARASQTSVDDLPTNAELATALDPLPTAVENAAAVWDEDATGHQTAGTFGQTVGDSAGGNSIRTLANDTLTNTGSLLIAVGNLPDDILDDPIPEPSGVFAWPATARNILAWEGALSRNKRTQSNTTQTLRNDADNADLATAGTDDTAGVVTREEWV